ncbi:MAG TPA: hypothetical protein VK899_07810, partial [Gemmatimonadales bacterium]|nr:hypothetical protein [Gemmatimonadales bacterium]
MVRRDEVDLDVGVVEGLGEQVLHCVFLSNDSSNWLEAGGTLFYAPLLDMVRAAGGTGQAQASRAIYEA